METEKEFMQLVGAVLGRFFAQNAQPPLSGHEIAGFASRLWSLVFERGLPAPLAAHECGAPGGMSDAECAPLVERVLDGARGALLADAARQLVKACFYPEFKTCRDSFRQVSPDGICRRQELARARGRVSGLHCVDCPHWVALGPTEHGQYLAREWCGKRPGAEEFWTHRGVFLPEDFRALRRWLHAQARKA